MVHPLAQNLPISQTSGGNFLSGSAFRPYPESTHSIFHMLLDRIAHFRNELFYYLWPRSSVGPIFIGRAVIICTWPHARVTPGMPISFLFRDYGPTPRTLRHARIFHPTLFLIFHFHQTNSLPIRLTTWPPPHQCPLDSMDTTTTTSIAHHPPPSGAGPIDSYW